MTLGRTGQGPASEFALTEAAEIVQTPGSVWSGGTLGVRNARGRRLHAIAPPVELLAIGILGLLWISLGPGAPRLINARILAAHLLLGLEAVVDRVEDEAGLYWDGSVDEHKQHPFHVPLLISKPLIGPKLTGA